MLCCSAQCRERWFARLLPPICRRRRIWLRRRRTGGRRSAALSCAQQCEQDDGTVHQHAELLHPPPRKLKRTFSVPSSQHARPRRSRQRARNERVPDVSVSIGRDQTASVGPLCGPLTQAHVLWPATHHHSVCLSPMAMRRPARVVLDPIHSTFIQHSPRARARAAARGGRLYLSRGDTSSIYNRGTVIHHRYQDHTQHISAFVAISREPHSRM